jgi:CDP-diacylglycerol--glycerol-3-phosphate 3-phosphatidyltransferase
VTAPRFDLGTYLDAWSGAHGGYDPRLAFWPRTWLRLVHVLAVPLARRRVSPDALTVVGLAVAGAVPAVVAPGDGWPLLAVPVVVASAVVDSLDGAVALLTGRTTRFGYVLDSVCDRLAEALYVVALALLGAPVWLCSAALALAWLPEYTRARAVGAGMTEIGVVTVWERATRVVVTAFGVGLAGIAGLAGTSLADRVAAACALAWVVLGVLGTAQLLIAVRLRLLRRPDQPGDDPG